MINEIKQIEVEWKKIPVTHDLKRELILTIETKQTELLETFLKKTILNDSGFEAALWNHKTFIYPETIEWMLVTYNVDGNYYIYIAHMEGIDEKIWRNFMESMHDQVVKSFWTKEAKIENRWKIVWNNFMYLWIQQTWEQKALGLIKDALMKKTYRKKTP